MQQLSVPPEQESGISVLPGWQIGCVQQAPLPVPSLLMHCCWPWPAPGLVQSQVRNEPSPFANAVFAADVVQGAAGAPVAP